MRAMEPGNAVVRPGRSLFELKELERQQARAAEFDRFATQRDHWRAKSRAYGADVERLVRFVGPEGLSVLEIGCGPGDLRAPVKPSKGLGVDFPPAMITVPRSKHPGIDFTVANAET